MELRIDSIKIMKVLIFLVVILTVASLAGQIYKYHGGRERYLVSFFDLDKEWNLPTLYASISLLFCSLLLAIICLAKKQNNGQFFYHWLLLAFVFFIMALDEVLQFHEQTISPLRHLLHAGGIFYYTWVVLGAFFVVVFVIAYLKFLLHLSARIRWLFIISGGLYTMGSLGFELLGGYYAEAYGNVSFTYAVLANVEELLEMIGILIFIYTLMEVIGTEIKNLKITVVSVSALD